MMNVSAGGECVHLIGCRVPSGEILTTNRMTAAINQVNRNIASLTSGNTKSSLAIFHRRRNRCK
jgi:hypothetical protein